MHMQGDQAERNTRAAKARNLASTPRIYDVLQHVFKALSDLKRNVQ